MNNTNIHVVTGAFGYSGKYIARRLLDAGYEVRTLTNSPDRHNPFGNKIEVHPFDFNRPEKLVESLRGCSVLYNTYWVRFNYGTFSHSSAVDNTLKLFDAAKKAGVKRIVHISITNPSEESPFEYFRGKAQLEKALSVPEADSLRRGRPASGGMESGLSYAILRPAVLFGKEDILINNIAWMLRKFPVFGVFSAKGGPASVGGSNYRLQPIYVDDLARLAVEQGGKSENKIIDAIGPETFTYRELVKEIGRIIGYPRPVVSIPPSMGYLAGWVVGKIMKDVLITREEIDGLMADLLCTDSLPTGKTKLTDWAKANAETLGLHYASELIRRR